MPTSGPSVGSIDASDANVYIQGTQREIIQELINQERIEDAISCSLSTESGSASGAGAETWNAENGVQRILSNICSNRSLV